MAKHSPDPVTPEQFFDGHPLAHELYRVVRSAVESVGEASVRVSKSQIAFTRGRTFAAVWMPEQYLHGDTALLVLTVYVPTRIDSRRWKEVVEPSPGRFTHHLELWEPDDVDTEVIGWLVQAWTQAAR